MPIKVYADRIEIGAKTITTTPTGIRIGDSLAANTQQQGYISQANFTARELALGAFGFQGSVSGFSSGGGDGPSSLNTIDKFPFAADTNASDHGDTLSSGGGGAGQSSATHGYLSAAGPTFSNVIQKFPFSVASNATDVGDLTQTRTNPAGQSSSVSGYTCGGYAPGSETNRIDKFPFATNTNATDVGDLLTNRGQLDGQGETSATHGYVSGGTGASNVIQKFLFATDSNTTGVGSLIAGRATSTGASSLTHGYCSGGSVSPGFWTTFTNTIEKFPFAADTNASSVGNLSGARATSAGQSSTTSGYVSGGQIIPGPPGTRVNTIDKFPFATDTNATDIGDLTQARASVAGQQF